MNATPDRLKITERFTRTSPQNILSAARAEERNAVAAASK
jgi:hypothetical protein